MKLRLRFWFSVLAIHLLWSAGCAGGTAVQRPVDPPIFVSSDLDEKLEYLQIEYPERLRDIVVSGKPAASGGDLAEYDLGTELEKALRQQAETVYERVDIVNRAERNVTPLVRVKSVAGSMDRVSGSIQITAELWAKASYSSDAVTSTIVVNGGSEDGRGSAALGTLSKVFVGVDTGGYTWQKAANWGNRAISAFNVRYADFIGDALMKNREVAKTDPRPVTPIVATPVLPMTGGYIVRRLEPAGRSPERRVALVIGNAAYEANPLANPDNDARDLAYLLSSQGFAVDLHINANLRQFDEAVVSFGRSLRREGGIGMFYYAGHAVQVEGENYLLPIGHGVESEADIKYKALNASKVFDEMGYARNGLNIVVLDACRDNPLPKTYTRSAARGLAIVKRGGSAQGMFIAYATEPGNVAQDGAGENGLYTSHLLRALQQPGRQLELVFKDVLRGVKKESGGRQIPWTSSSFDGEFVFQH